MSDRRTLSLTTVALLALAVAIPFARSGQAPAPELQKTRVDIEQRVDAMLAQLTLEEKVGLLGGVDGFYAPGVPKLGLPRMKMSDGPAGARNDGPATTMAGGVALAATWNEALAREVGSEIGRDARARGVHFMLGPGVNLHVSPLNGRNFEYFGEDPFLAGRIAARYIEGLQQHGVSATVKHMMANNSEFARHEVDVIIDERTMREMYLSAFEAAVREGRVGAIMTSYNLVNGAHMSQQGRVTSDIVKREWGFDGLVMSDWGATYDGVGAANGGQDVEMPGPQYMKPETLLSAIRDGRVSVATIDDKVRRLLRTAVRFGWMDREQADLSIPTYNQHGRIAALEGAREGIVLLKNERGVLPLDRAKARTIALIGPLAYPGAPVGGGSGETAPFANVSLLQGLSNMLGTGATVTHHRGLLTLAQIAAAAQFFTEPQGKEPGLRAEVFDNATLSGTPVSTRVDRRLNQKPAFTIAEMPELNMGELFASLQGSEPPKPKSTRWTGYYTAKTAGDFEVFLQGGAERGGIRLAIDGTVVFDNWTVRKALLSSTVMRLEAGPHKVVVEQFSSGGFDLFGGAVRMGIARQDALVSTVAKALAAKADAVVVAVGWDAVTETEGGDRTFGLPIGQNQLIREIAAASANTIVVVTAGGAVDTRPWIDRVPALLAAWFPGQEGGTALAEILMGEVNPSGHLPISYDRSWEENPSFDSYYPEPGTKRVVYRNGVFVGYRGYEKNGRAPLYPFGYGLSYTTFTYANLQIVPVGSSSAPAFDVSFDVTNTGPREGAAVAQVYVGDSHAKVARPPKELKGFAKAALKSGETRRMTVRLDARAFTYYDVTGHQWRADAGEFAVLVGSSSAQIELKGTVTLKSDVTIAPGS